jgi:hypothetical protein
VKLTRRHARALATGAAATAAYLAGAKLSDSRVIRAGTLLTLALTATVSAQQASALAKTTKKRLDQHVADTANAVHLYNAHGTALNSLANNSAVLLTLAGASDPTFLASINGPMGHQTTANNTIDTTAGSLSNADRVSINGLVNAVNTLQSHLQTANIEA